MARERIGLFSIYTKTITAHRLSVPVRDTHIKTEVRADAFYTCGLFLF